jgi:hypothetical protein
MNLFDLLGYRSESPYSRSSKTNVGEYALIISGGPASYTLNGSAGTYTLSGQAATLTAVTGKSLSANNGVYNLIGSDAELTYTPIVVEIISKGGLPKAKSSKKYKKESELRAELEKIIKDEFDKLDGTYVAEAVEAAKQEVMPQIQQIEKFDDTQYKIAIAQINALLLQAKIRTAEIQSELDDEEAILMLL